MISLLPLLLGAPALAQSDPVPVFVSELQPADSDAAGIAGLLTYYLTEQLNALDEVTASGADDAPDFGEHSARIYLSDCPRGQEVGCAYIVADAVEAQFAVTGVVGTLAEGGQQIELYIVDVVGAREAVHFTVNLAVGDDQAFLDGVTELLLAVIRGDKGLQQDIRDMGGVEGDTRLIDKDLIAKQLDELSQEMGDESTITTRNSQEVRRSQYGMDQLADDMESDGAKPWERLGMTPGAYMDFKNSGLTLQAWQELAAGRRFQLIIRGGGGLMRGPVGSSYYGQYGIQPATGEIVEWYAWETRTSDSGPMANLWIGFGVLPILEVAVGGGYVGGPYKVEIQQFVVGAENSTKPGEVFSANNLMLGGRALAVLMPTSRVHPVAGGGVSWVVASRLDSHILPPQSSELPVFPRRTSVIAAATVGVDVTVNPLIDLYAHVPIGVAIGGNLREEDRDGGGVLEGSLNPTDPGAFSAGLDLGVSVRLFGGKPKEARYDELEEEGL